MAVNMFVPIRSVTDAKMAASSASAMGCEYDAFEWCSPFEGEGGCLLTLEQALAFEGDDKAPWFLALPPDDPDGITEDNLLDGELFWCSEDAKFENSQVDVADWRGILKDSKCNTVLFMKARL